ncbi:receptor kinase-like protein Xa21 [Ziziphus jujuba]|uniref:Receptor kinase-like protein Xa21 n=1 Tax=Ziziphus jujuba TaxID=326968 RepID=A0ABM3IL03_ZIZJJ|nr:receptor kinase-like protein Xa21 [Ziziphus jujuba]
MKHVGVDFHFVRDKVVEGLLRVSHVSSKYQLADGLTKSLPRQRLEFLRSKLGVLPRPPSLRGHISDSYAQLHGDMVAHVADFRIANMLGKNALMTQTKTLATIGYMAPEYGLDGIVSTKGDVYSYGILLMETFTGKKTTDKMFVEDLSLRKWVKESFSFEVTEVADKELLGEEKAHRPVVKVCLSSIRDTRDEENRKGRFNFTS